MLKLKSTIEAPLQPTFSASVTYGIEKTISKEELPSSVEIKRIRRKYKQVTTKKEKLLLFVEALNEGKYRFIQDQGYYIVQQGAVNLYYTPMGVFLDICSHVVGWRISEQLDKNIRYIFPKWNKKYDHFNKTLMGYNVLNEDILIKDEIGLKRPHMMDFYTTSKQWKNKPLSYKQLADELLKGFKTEVLF